MTKEQFIDARTKIISKMLDNPDASGIYPTTIAFAELDDLFDQLMNYDRGPSWAQIHRNDSAMDNLTKRRIERGFLKDYKKT